jgi:hypothetical protein
MIFRRCFMLTVTLALTGLLAAPWVGQAQVKEDKKDEKKDEKKDDKKDKDGPIIFKGDVKPISHAFKWTAGQKYMIDLKAKNFQPIVGLRQGQNPNLLMNQGSNSYNATTKEYQVSFTYVAGANDVYHLEVARNGNVAGSGPEEYTLSVSMPKLILTKAEQLNLNDPVYPNRPNCRFKAYTVRLRAGVSYLIELDATANNFNPFLYLEDGGGKILMSNYAGGGSGFKSRITYQPTQTGDFKLVATSLSPNQQGQFTLSVAEAVTEPAPVKPPKKQ